MEKWMEELVSIVSPIYMVGGCVRDIELGREPNDYDFCTPLMPEEIERRIQEAGKRVYQWRPHGKKLGVIGAKFDGHKVEISTFRAEKYTNCVRRPSEISFVKDITADLSRRDFTINAMAKRLDKDQAIIDPFGGRKDLADKRIRAVGKPSERFKEDPLRMLRACRFAAQLGFNINMDTLDKMKQLSYKILSISRERWNDEMDKLLMSDLPVIGLKILYETRLINYMIPPMAIQKDYDQNSPYHQMSLFGHTMIVVHNVPRDINLRWAAFLHDIGKPFVRTEKIDRSNYINHDLVGAEMVEAIGRYMKWSNERRETVVNLIRNHLQDDSPLREADHIGKTK